MGEQSALQHLISLLLSPTKGLNWVDYAISVVILFYAIEGFTIGFISALFDLFSFILSFAIGLTVYSSIGKLLIQYLSLPPGFANAIGFFVAAFMSEILFNILFKLLHRYLAFKKPHIVDQPSFDDEESSFLATLDHVAGIVPGVISACIFLAFLLTLIVSLPLSPLLKHMVSSSKLAPIFIANTQGLEKNIKDVFGGAVNETISFLTVEPQSNESVALHFTTTNVSVDTTAEQQMFAMVNQERTTRGLAALTFDTALQTVARAHAKDMFARGYFSHYTPEGLSPFDRMTKANITFTAAGENLALAPNVDLAMQGLMQSPGHRANILSKDFGRIGVGVIDGGIYGEMFVQEFTD